MRDVLIEFDRASVVRTEGVKALHEFSLRIQPGEVVAFVGRSGAGKSTALKLVNRLLLPTDGSVRLEGRDTREWNPYVLRRRIGYVLQEIGLFPHMTVEQNVAVIPELEGQRPEQVRARTAELLDLVGLPSATFARRWPGELSGGQRQRVGVARALALDPPILLMDEPFGALDPVTRAEMHTELKTILSRVRKTVLIVSHDMGEAFTLAERIAVLEEGRLVACESPEALAKSDDPRVRILLDAAAPPAVLRVMTGRSG